MADQETPSTLPGPGLTPQGELSRRIKLLLDAAVAERGQSLTFREISEALATRGVNLSRARWSYLKDGNGRVIQDRPLLTALAGYFNVSPDYLVAVGDIEISEEAWEQLESVHSLRAERVKSFAQQTLGDVSPETLEAITEYLNARVPPRPGRGAAGDSADSPGEPPIEP